MNQVWLRGEAGGVRCGCEGRQVESGVVLRRDRLEAGVVVTGGR